MSEDVRCYICKRNIHDVVELFGIKFQLAREKMKEMTAHKFSAAVDLDRRGERIYEFIHWDELFNFKSQLSPRIRKWYDSMDESGGRQDEGIIVYSYKHSISHSGSWVARYMENGGILLDDSEVEKVRVDYDFHLCPVCQSLYARAG